jgi:hypothetical protein
MRRGMSHFTMSRWDSRSALIVRLIQRVPRELRAEKLFGRQSRKPNPDKIAIEKTGLRILFDQGVPLARIK